jgi:FkbM family methyltransferase
MLIKNVAAYGKRCEPLLAAVWPSETTLVLDVPKGPMPEWGISVRPGDGNTKAVTIPSLLARSGEQRISILKIDIEGAEFELFRSRPDWIGLVDNIVIELHGSTCESVFYDAIAHRDYSISRSGELTICYSGSSA